MQTDDVVSFQHEPFRRPPEERLKTPQDASRRLKMGISDGLVRLSVGIENVEDILADLEQSLAYRA